MVCAFGSSEYLDDVIGRVGCFTERLVEIQRLAQQQIESGQQQAERLESIGHCLKTVSTHLERMTQLSAQQSVHMDHLAATMQRQRQTIERLADSTHEDCQLS